MNWIQFKWKWSFYIEEMSLYQRKLELTTEVARFTSMEGWPDHVCRAFINNSSIWESNIFSMASAPQWFNIMLLKYLWTRPCAVVLLSPSIVKILEYESKYHNSTSLPSCLAIWWLNSGSVDTTTGQPAKLVRNIGPYLRREKKRLVRLSHQ